MNISREFRKQRKARRLEKLAKAKLKREAKKDVSKQTKGKGKAADNVSEEDEHSGPEQENDEDKESSSSSDGEGEGKNDDANTDSESDYLSENGPSKAGKSEGTSTKVQKGKTSTKKRLRWKGRKRAELLYKDMYKMFDGSALLALGKVQMPLSLTGVLFSFCFFLSSLRNTCWAQACWFKSRSHAS